LLDCSVCPSSLMQYSPSTGLEANTLRSKNPRVMMRFVVVSLLFLAIISPAGAAAAKSDVKGHRLASSNAAPADETIASVPELMPNYRYKKHLEDVFQEANPDAVKHQDKLQKQNRKLRRKVLDLEAQLGDGETREMSDELGAVVATSAEFEQDRARSVGLLSTLLILGAILTGAQVTAMAQNKDFTVKAKTWSVMEKILIIFVAVMWFQVFDDFFSWAGLSLQMEVLISCIHAIVVFVVIVVVASSMMKKKQTQTLVAVLTAWGMHYLSFMLVHAGSHAQDAFFSQYIWLCFVGVFVCFIVFAGFSALTRKILLKQYENADDSHFVDNIEELEDDASGMMLAYVFIMLVRFCICGTYHDLQADGSMHHTAWQRAGLLIYALVVSAAALLLQARLNLIGERLESTLGGYFGQRMILLLNPFLVMLVVWSFMLWADWEFFEHLFRGEEIMGHVVWSTLCTIVSFGLVYLYAKQAKRVMHPDRNNEDRLRRQSSKAMDLAWRWADLEKRKYLLNAVAVMVAFSWAQSFSVSIDAAVEWRAHPFGVKAVLTALVTAVAFPVYFFYVRHVVPLMERGEDQELELHK